MPKRIHNSHDYDYRITELRNGRHVNSNKYIVVNIFFQEELGTNVPNLH